MIDALLFVLFGLTLLGIASMHKHALRIAVGGLILVATTRTLFSDFDLAHHLQDEWPELVNLGGLLLGFALLANHFEASLLPRRLTALLPGGRMGPVLLLVLVAVLSSVLDNIAAALIGGAAAFTLFQGRVHTGYLAAIVAASNAGGAGSVVGDTTTTMLWLAGASPWWVARAFLGSVVAVTFVAWAASRQQQALQPLVRDADAASTKVDGARLYIVAGILVGAVTTNLVFGYPAAGVWGALVIGSLWRQPEWTVLGGASKSTVFLLSLVLSASMMPVEQLPPASVTTAFGLGIVSAFFDNIPLTKLAIEQDGYDWGLLAFAVGYGGSMLWFGSSAGVALSSGYAQMKSAAAWIKNGWHVAVAYLLATITMIVVFGWDGHSIHGHHHPIGEPAAPSAGEHGPK